MCSDSRTLRRARRVWKIRPRIKRDRYNRRYLVENRFLLRRSKTVLHLKLREKDYFPHVKIRIGSVHGKYAFSTDLGGTSGGGWGTSYAPSIWCEPYDTCQEAYKAALEEALKRWEKWADNEDHKASADDKKMLTLIKREMGPKQMELF